METDKKITSYDFVAMIKSITPDFKKICKQTSELDDMVYGKLKRKDTK